MAMQELIDILEKMDAKLSSRESSIKGISVLEVVVGVCRLLELKNLFSWLKFAQEFSFVTYPMEVMARKESLRRTIFFFRGLKQQIELQLFIEDERSVFTEEVWGELKQNAVLVWPALECDRYLPGIEERKKIIFSPEISSVTISYQELLLNFYLDEDVVCETFIDYPEVCTDKENIFTDLPYTYKIATLMAQENFLGLIIPPRAQVLRMLLLEWERITEHLRVIHQMIVHLGADAYATLFEKLIYTMATHFRYTADDLVLGGVTTWPCGEWFTRLYELLRTVSHECQTLFKFITRARTWQSQTKISGMLASWGRERGLSGPLLRASGVGYDLRKQRGHYYYPEIDFEIPVGVMGDVHDIYLVRMEEIFYAIKIIQALLRALPSGGVVLPREEIHNSFKSGVEMGTYVYTALEAPSGELGFGVSVASSGLLVGKMFSGGWSSVNSWPLMIKGLTVEEGLLVFIALGIKSEEYRNTLFLQDTLVMKECSR
ncbi:MAG: hypothetical protein HQK52_20805 [Oligoflexia bacterium]|nr:hypothetical protein [Oligoflexia bacterium]